MSGEIDMSGSGSLEAITADAPMVRSVTILVIVLNDLAFLDFSGTRALLMRYNIAADQGASFRVENPGEFCTAPSW